SEAVYAKAVAEHLGTDHTEVYLHAEQALAVIPLLPDLYDEPFADSSQIPTFLVAQTARQYVTAALSGDGGDELFGGYNRYIWIPKIWRNISRLPYGLRRKFCRLFIHVSGMEFVNWQSRVPFLPDRLRVVQVGDKLRKLGERLQNVRNLDDFYLSLLAEWRTPEDILLAGHEPSTLLNDRSAWPELRRPEERMMYLDAMTYLPDDILCKVDRAAMGVSLETRVPFLDHRVAELAWRIPFHMKIRNGRGKWALRRILYKYVPQELIERPKQGFSVPLGGWLLGPLREWAENLLAPSRLSAEGYFRPEPIQRKWREHVRGERNWEHSLWSILMFQAWLEAQSEGG
ncbi:MAG: asparagine synthetase B, partial [Candidatus Electrothrix sp. AR4]|nr:asparagine synthetase B [Candidatus Electrothrix sp. AR4]